MSRIRILPETLSNKIAAGEVVERPASVVKELVENAIDAGGTRILVEIEQGGRKLIRVSDNGNGMGRDDALLCLERFATSKIRTDPDLFAIRTLGFRGEALPSIASISRLHLITREADADTGTRIEVTGGRISTVTDTGAPAGTMVSIKDLFFNTPARRKFLKSMDTEMGHIADTLSSMGLCHSAIQFRLSHNQRMIKNWAPVADPLDRVVDILGDALKRELHPVAMENDAGRVSGWVASPRMNRSTTRGIYFFVNGRWVRDRVLQHAILAGYSNRLMKGQYPVAVLFLGVPFDQVDVNVHPTKHEVRFLLQQKVHDAVRDAVAESLKKTDPALKSSSFPRPVPDLASASSDAPAIMVSESSARYTHETPAPASDIRPSDVSSLKPADPKRSHASIPVIDGSDPFFRKPPSVSPRTPAAFHRHLPLLQPEQPPEQTPLWERRFFSDLRVIGQYRGTYIVCESDDGLILIDQHAAHERIVFERLKSSAFIENPVVQHLILPESIELTFREAQILSAIIPQLNHYGMEIEPFGKTTFVVRSLPTLIDSKDIRDLIVRIVENAAEVGVHADVETLTNRFLMVMACHNAIRAHQWLADDQIKAMLEQLDQCENPSNCPHGRPVWIRWRLAELEKQFQRMV